MPLLRGKYLLRKAVLASVFLQLSCSAVPDKPVYVEQEYTPTYVDVDADCEDVEDVEEGKEAQCEISEHNLTQLLKVIDEKNGEGEKMTEAIGECKHQIALADYEIIIMENQATTNRYINLGRNAFYLAVCAGGVLYGN